MVSSKTESPACGRQPEGRGSDNRPFSQWVTNVTQGRLTVLTHAEGYSSILYENPDELHAALRHKARDGTRIRIMYVPDTRRVGLPTRLTEKFGVLNNDNSAPQHHGTLAQADLQ